MGEKGTVYVTGAPGFVASWLIKRLLESGYCVKGTVRNPGDYKKVAHLWELEGAKERLQLVNADLIKAGSFDDAVMGCEGVFHIASPVVITGTDPKVEILDPAVNGTLNVLQSCKKNPTLKRVVLTSSSSALRIREDIDPTVPLNESSWSSEELCHKYKVDFAMGILSKLVNRQIWKMPKFWVGFLKLVSQTHPLSFSVLLQLPSLQLENALNKYVNLKTPLAAYASQPNVRATLERKWNKKEGND